MISGGNPEVANRESSRSYLSTAASTVAVEDSGLDMGKHRETRKAPTPVEQSWCHA